MPEVAHEYTETQITPPVKTFRDSVSLELGRRRVEPEPFRSQAIPTTTSSPLCRTFMSSSPAT